MPGYEMNNTNTSFNLMMRRLGIPYDYSTYMDKTRHSKFDEAQRGIEDMATILRANGGYTQQQRMIFDKRRSFDRALKYSYQSAVIKKIQCEDNLDNSIRPNIVDLDKHTLCRALINPNKLKMDYDDKILSVHFEENYHTGDIFEWVGTDSYWLIYLQDMTETAYFRGEIRKCSYEIEWEDANGKNKTFAAIRGPVETKINYIQKHTISVDIPNHSINILMPRTKENLEYFKRYSKFYLKGMDEGSPNICWRVEATDWISTPGILEVNAVEYYSNEIEDDVANGVVGGLKVKQISPNDKEDEYMIKGDTFIKPKQVYEYRYSGLSNSEWKIDDNKPVKISVNPKDPLHIKLIWESTFSGQFDLKYGKYSKTIVVESLF